MSQKPEVSRPTDKFMLPISSPLLDLDGKELTEDIAEGDVKKKKVITLGDVLVASVNSPSTAEGVTLDVIDRLTLAQRFRKGKDCEVKVSTCEQLKKIVKVHFAHSPILSGGALIMLGATPNEDL